MMMMRMMMIMYPLDLYRYIACMRNVCMCTGMCRREREEEEGSVRREERPALSLPDHTRCNAALGTLVLCARSGAHSALSAQ